MKQSYVRLPNRLIEDTALHYSSKRVAAAMFAYTNPEFEVRKTISELAELSHCCPATVQQAIRELMSAGYLTRERKYRYSRALARPVFASCVYRVNREMGDSYTLVPREIFKVDVTHAGFCCLLYLYCKAGRTGRAYPSLRRMAEVMQMGKATVCRVLKALEQLQMLVKRFCVKLRGDKSCNSYYLTGLVMKRRPSRAAASWPNHTMPLRRLTSAVGSLIFDKHPVIKKITKGITLGSLQIKSQARNERN